MSECPWPNCHELPTVTVVEPPTDDEIEPEASGAPAGRYCVEHAQRVRDGDSWSVNESEPECVESDVRWQDYSTTEASDA